MGMHRTQSATSSRVRDLKMGRGYGGTDRESAGQRNIRGDKLQEAADTTATPVVAW